MPVYRIMYDHIWDVVEAENLKQAIDIWRKEAALENDGEEYDPESAELISERPVLR